MNIGQGGIQLAHLAVLNSITYDQRRRNLLINYRNSTAYAAGLIVPILSFFCFRYVTTEQDQFAYIANCCLVIGAISTMVFLFFINEVKLVRESRKVFNEHLLIESDKPDSQGVILDTDRTEDQSSADFGN